MNFKDLSEAGIRGLLALITTVGLVIGSLYLVINGDSQRGIDILSIAAMAALSFYFATKKTDK